MRVNFGQTLRTYCKVKGTNTPASLPLLAERICMNMTEHDTSMPSAAEPTQRQVPPPALHRRRFLLVLGLVAGGPVTV